MRGPKVLIAAVVGAIVAGPAMADGPGSRPRLDLVPNGTSTAPRTPAPAAQPKAPAPKAPTAPTLQQSSATLPAEAAPSAPGPRMVGVAPPAPSRTSGFALPGGLEATVPASLTFYPAPEAQAYMSRIGAAPPSGQVAGMIAPAGRAPTDADFWAAVVSYEPVGYVPETNTAALAAPSFISETRAARGPTAPRVEEFPVQPVYVSSADTLMWAERVAPAPGQTRTVTLSQRLLGREGVAKLDANLRPDQLAEAQSLAGPMLASLTFAAGKRHTDFAAGEKEAVFDVPGLVTGRRKAADGAVALATPSTATTVSESGGSSGGVPGWAPWAAIGAAVAGAVSWLAFLMRRNRDTIDPNLTPS